MARIPADELDRLKREVSIERLVESKGVKLEKRGADLFGLCPWHDDKDPSLVVSPAKNLWHCLGACQTGGDVIAWVMKAEGVRFRHAVELLRADHPLSSTTTRAKHSTVAKLPPAVDASVEDAQLLGQVAGYYHEALKQSPEALAYLKLRGIDSPELIDHFQLGFANRTLGYHLPQKNRVAGEAVRTRLQQLGVLRDTGHEHFNGSIVIPIVDERGVVRGMYGRKIRDDLRPGTPKHLYLPGPHRGVFNAGGLANAAHEVILCESLIDALSFWAAGLHSVTTSYGVEGFTDEILAALKKSGTHRVVIAYDADDAGEAAATKLAPRLVDAGFSVRRQSFPRGMDANEYAVQRAEKGGLMKLYMSGSMWMGEPKRPRPPSPFADVPGRTAKEEPHTPSSTTEVARNDLPLAALPTPAPAQTYAESAAAVAESPPSSPPDAPPVEAHGDELVIPLGDRRYRVRGLAKNTSFDVLKVNVHVSKDDAFFVDTLDLYAAKHRAAFIAATAGELDVVADVVKKDLGRVLLALEERVDAAMKELLEPAQATPAMTEEEHLQALDLLQDPRLLDRILEDFERCGVVGEETNKLVGYLAAVSRKLDDPLAVIIQSSSAAGKSSLMEAVLALMPDEDRIKYSAMTGQSLFYMGETNLQHKILAIVEEEGAERASYALKLLQSEKELTIASTGKDPQTGKHVTHEYRVCGPVMIFLTTTAISVDDELLNRCMVLTVDEDRAQTKAIHALQRRRQTLAGLLAAEDKSRILAVHKNAQRLLRPLLVANPFAEKLTFLDDKTRTRRDHMKYLTLIRSIALLHQHQRRTKTVEHHGRLVEYIEATIDDVATANRLAHEVLGRTLDELPPQTRKLLLVLDEMASKIAVEKAMDKSNVRITRREILEATGWGLTQLRVHLARLVEHEHLAVHQGGRGLSFVYEVLYAGGDTGAPFLPGLIDVAALGGGGADATTTPTWRGSEGQLAGSWRGQSGALAGGWRGDETAKSPRPDAPAPVLREETGEKALHRAGAKNGAYSHEVAVVVEAGH